MMKRNFLRDRKGLAALEFAIVAPMMLALMLGSVEIINLLQTQRRVENTGSSMADVVSRDTVITNSEMTGFWSAVNTLMFPNSAASINMRVTSIMINSATDARVVWFERRGGVYTDLGANAAVTGLPAAMMIPGTSVIRVETTYVYHPVLGFFFVDGNRELHRDGTGRLLQNVAYRRARVVDPVTRSNTA